MNSDWKPTGESELDTQTVMFVLTNACNLKCVYCYENTVYCNDKGVVKKVTSNPPIRMESDRVKEIIDRHMRQDRFTAISFDFFGGEPLLEFDLIKDVVEWFHTKEWNKAHRFTISTNGTLFNEEIKSWLVKWRDCVFPMVSLDGTKEAHDRNRCKSYDRVATNIGFLRDNWPEQSVRMTIGPHTIDHVADGFIQLHNLGLNVEASVVFENVWGDENSKKNYLDRYAEQLHRLVEFYGENPQLEVPLILSRDVTAILAKPSEDVKYCGAGEYMACYTADGIAYPCHRFIPLSSTKPSTGAYEKIANISRIRSECDNCEMINICPTCEGMNWEENGDVRKRTNFHCEFFKLEARASAKLQIRKIQAQIKDNTILEQDLLTLSTKILAIQRLMMAPKENWVKGI